MLRTAVPEDAAAVAFILAESRRVFMPYTRSPHSAEETIDWIAQQLIPSGRVTVATRHGELVAMLAVSETDDAAWIDQLYVLPGHENQGLGSDLLRFAHESLRKPIRLFTFQQNIGARRFYERHGYKVVAVSDGKGNEEKCPDVLYELSGEN